MDMGKIIAIDTKEALKGQVAVDEKFYIEANNMPQKALEEIKRLPNVKNIGYDKKVLSLELPKEKAETILAYSVILNNIEFYNLTYYCQVIKSIIMLR